MNRLLSNKLNDLSTFLVSHESVAPTTRASRYRKQSQSSDQDTNRAYMQDGMLKREKEDDRIFHSLNVMFEQINERSQFLVAAK